MRERHILNIIVIVTVILIYFTKSFYICFLPLAVSIIFTLLKFVPYKPTKRLYWKLLFKKEVIDIVTKSVSPLFQYPMIIWIELGDCQEQFVNNRYTCFTNIVSDKYAEMAMSIVDSMRGKDIKHTYYESDSDLDWDEEEFIDKIQNDYKAN